MTSKYSRHTQILDSKRTDAKQCLVRLLLELFAFNRKVLAIARASLDGVTVRTLSDQTPPIIAMGSAGTTPAMLSPKPVENYLHTAGQA